MNRGKMQRSYAAVYERFYKSLRMSALFLNDGGGPFGFDITLAIEVDFLIRHYRCDGIIETGCNMGDTTEYLASRYPQLSIISCDINKTFVYVACRRCARRKNVSILYRPSPLVVGRFSRIFSFPFLFLDAHGSGEWPLISEINNAGTGLFCIHDFNIKHPRFSYDAYDGIPCDFDLLREIRQSISPVYTNNPMARYPFPCLQIGRRSGRAYFTKGRSDAYLRGSQFFRRVKSSSSEVQ